MENNEQKNKGPHPCPVCGKTTFPEAGSYDICIVCGWEDEAWCEEYPDEESTANYRSLNQYRREYFQRVANDAKYTWIEEMKKK